MQSEIHARTRRNVILLTAVTLATFLLFIPTPSSAEGDYQVCDPYEPTTNLVEHCIPPCPNEYDAAADVYPGDQDCVEIPVFPTIAAGLFAVVGGGLAYVALTRRA